MDTFKKDNNTLVKFTNPTSVFRPKGYSQSVEINLGNSKMILISGQLSLDVEGNIVGLNDLEKQTEQVFLNIKSIIEDAGGTMNDIVKTAIFMTDISQLPVLRKVRSSYLNPEDPPTSTLLQVSQLFTNDFLIEIEATAIIKQ